MQQADFRWSFFMSTVLFPSGMTKDLSELNMKKLNSILN